MAGGRRRPGPLHEGDGRGRTGRRGRGRPGPRDVVRPAPPGELLRRADPALLDGRLDVPNGVLVQEAILHDGKEYLYWPPGPSLLRLPLFLVTDRFDGKLTPLMLVAGWTVFTVVFILLCGACAGCCAVARPWARSSCPATPCCWCPPRRARRSSTSSRCRGCTTRRSSGIAMALGTAHALLGFIVHPSRRPRSSPGCSRSGASSAAGRRATRTCSPSCSSPDGSPSAGGGDRPPVLAAPRRCGGPAPGGQRGDHVGQVRHPQLLSDGRTGPLSLEPVSAGGAGGQRRRPLRSRPRAEHPPRLPPAGRDPLHRAVPVHRRPARAAHGGGRSVFDTRNRSPSVVSFMPLLVGVALWGVVLAVRARRTSPVGLDRGCPCSARRRSRRPRLDLGHHPALHGRVPPGALPGRGDGHDRRGPPPRPPDPV